MSGHCITNDVFELRSCVVAGQHRANCDGHGRRREVVERFDRETHATFRARRTIILDTPCEGCLPRPSIEGGHVCEVHARKITDGIRRLPDLVAHLWSIDGPGRHVDDGVRVSGFESRMPIPSSRILVGELLAAASSLLEATLEPAAPRADVAADLRPLLLARISAFDDAGIVVGAAVEARALLTRADDMVWKRLRPARRAVEFARVASIAYRAFPTEDEPHRIPVLRCRTCDRLTLEWHPPLYFLDDDSIRCGSCGAVEDRSLYEHDVAVILAARTGRNTR